jgi:ATP-dependent helicase HrpA
MRHSASSITDERYPKTWNIMGTTLQLSYHFEPGSTKDGVTLIVPLALLNQIDERRSDWLVPGLCVEKIHLYLKSLPQKLRRHCVPLPDYAKNFVDHCLENSLFGKGDLLDALIFDIRERHRVVIQKRDFRPENLPAYCFMNYRLLDEHGRQLELERSLGLLQNKYAHQVREIFSKAAVDVVKQVISVVPEKNVNSSISPTPPLSSKPGSEEDKHHAKITQWSFGELPEILEIKKNRQLLIGYPACRGSIKHIVSLMYMMILMLRERPISRGYVVYLQ